MLKDALNLIKSYGFTLCIITYIKNSSILPLYGILGNTNSTIYTMLRKEEKKLKSCILYYPIKFNIKHQTWGSRSNKLLNKNSEIKRRKTHQSNRLLEILLFKKRKMEIFTSSAASELSSLNFP